MAPEDAQKFGIIDQVVEQRPAVDEDDEVTNGKAGDDKNRDES
jgi:hypothetical protein